MEKIYFKNKNESFKEFSNFYMREVDLDGKKWPSSEHYFQAMKFPHDVEYQEKIRTATSPQLAKKLGATRKIKIVEGWDDKRENVMEKILFAKFTQHADLKNILLSTGNAEIIEDTRDGFWGRGKGGKGKNKLGKLLESLRGKL